MWDRMELAHAVGFLERHAAMGLSVTVCGCQEAEPEFLL